MLAARKLGPLTYAATAAAIFAAIAVVEAPAVHAEETLPFKVVDGVSIPKSLTGNPGDPLRGKAVAINRKQGNCLACHILPIPEQPFHGEVGPDLSAIAAVYGEGELRLRVVNPKVVNPDTIMPAFYRTDGLNRVMKKFDGKTILSAQQVEDVVAYLLTLK